MLIVLALGMFLSIVGMIVVPHKVVALSPHDPIEIIGDTGFTNDSGVVRGSGTVDDPYIIEGWEITGVGGSGAAVHIKDTNASFIIRNLKATSTSSGIGVLLEDLANGTLDGLSVSDYQQSICILNSDNCAIVGCEVHNSVSEGVWLSNTVNVTVQRCTLAYNSYGIRTLDWRADHTKSFIENNFTGNGYGIFTDSPFVTVSCNSFSENNVGLRYSGGWATVTENLFSDSTSFAVMVLAGGPSSRIWNNTFINNNGASATYDSSHIQAYDDGTSTMWDVNGYGNFWSDWQSPDDNHDGVVDNPYHLADNPLHPVAGSDHYPMTVPTVVPEFAPALVAVVYIMIALILGASARRSS